MRVLCLVMFLVTVHFLNAQETSPFLKFGKVSTAHLQQKIYSIDSNASAIVLSDIGEAAVEGNSKGWFSISFTRHRVVHILNKNGYDEADVEISLYGKDGAEEKLENLKAVTYNFENGKITETKLDKSSVFREKINDNLSVRKFTFPNVKAGCIIEYEYEVVSDYIKNLDPWYFQGDAPVLWSEYKLSVPQFFTYTFMSQGYHPIYLNDSKDRTVNFSVTNSRTAGATERYTFSAGVSDFRWVMKDVPSLKEENFTSSIKNHISRIEFQLSSQSLPLEPRDYRNTWTGLTQQLLDASYFGKALDNNNNWLSGEIDPLLSTTGTDIEKVRKLYAFVRDNFYCTNYSARYADQPLKNVMRSKKGNVAEINLLLTAMLRYAGLRADPILLSTTDNGYAFESYPSLTPFNYVIVQCSAGGEKIYLDATHPRLGFGKLLPECYNGHARVVNEEATPVFFYADSIKERKVTTVFITNDEKKNWAGKFDQTLGYYGSYDLRQKIQEEGKENLFKAIQKEYGETVRVMSPDLDSLNNYEEPVALHYTIEFPFEKEDILYVNPMFNQRWRTNPFKSAVRLYPVEMPYTVDETYLLTMEIPDGYTVDELPKQIIAKLDEKESAYYEYRISQSGTTISLRSRLKISRTLFTPVEYENLREFFNLIVNKQNEQIVFKKKK